MIFLGTESMHHHPFPGVERREVACGIECQIIEFRLKGGAVIPLHQHANEQVGMVISGRMALKIGTDENELRAGDGYSIPPGVPHSVIILEDSVVFDVFSPPRADYHDR